MKPSDILAIYCVVAITASGLWALGGCWIGFWRWYRGDDLFDDGGL